MGRASGARVVKVLGIAKFGSKRFGGACMCCGFEGVTRKTGAALAAPLRLGIETCDNL